MRMAETEKKKEVVFKLVNDEDMPPIIIRAGEDDMPEVIINRHYSIWLSLHRKLIAGCAESLYGKIDELLTSYLTEQRMFERMG